MTNKVMTKEEILNLRAPLEFRILAMSFFGKGFSDTELHVPSYLLSTKGNKALSNAVTWDERCRIILEGERTNLLPTQTVLGDTLPDKFLNFDGNLYRLHDVGGGLDGTCFSFFVDNNLPSGMKLWRNEVCGGCGGSNINVEIMKYEEIKFYTDIPRLNVTPEEIRDTLKQTWKRRRGIFYSNSPDSLGGA